jgi:hypothetical protein
MYKYRARKNQDEVESQCLKFTCLHDFRKLQNEGFHELILFLAKLGFSGLYKFGFIF